ncbi:hypothetical protein V8G54_020310 [Vigna mungo]|uniref:Cytochrome P450 n=1 Tax=Vigna mungo TaxID=3915 RepID=A0AAQ3RW96_VIGMU
MSMENAVLSRAGMIVNSSRFFLRKVTPDRQDRADGAGHSWNSSKTATASSNGPPKSSMTAPTNTAVMSRSYRFNIVVTANPHNVEHMLKTRFENYPKGERFIHPLQDLLGNGIFNSDSELWKVQRKVASYEFTTSSLRNFIVNSITTELQTRLLPILSKASQTNRVLDLQNLLERFSFDNICKLAFNVDPACLGGDCTAGTDFMSAFEDATKLSSERRLRESITTVHEFADSIIRSRLEAKEHTRDDEDLLSRFSRTKESSPEFLCDVVISFILAGRDSTSSALTWCFWILSSRPHNGVCRTESPFRFPVFHAGPRMCLGKEMAYVQMKSIAASVVEKFEIEAADRDTCPEHLLL